MTDTLSVILPRTLLASVPATTALIAAAAVPVAAQLPAAADQAQAAWLGGQNERQ